MMVSDPSAVSLRYFRFNTHVCWMHCILLIMAFSIYMHDKCRIVGINHVIDVDTPNMVKEDNSALS